MQGQCSGLRRTLFYDHVLIAHSPAASCCPCRALPLQDHSKRPSAREALQHPWLQGPGTSERGKGKKLSMGVVQRIQVWWVPGWVREGVVVQGLVWGCVGYVFKAWGPRGGPAGGDGLCWSQAGRR